MKEKKEVYDASTDCMDSQFEQAFQCHTIGFIQIVQKEWVKKNTLLMSKKLQESLNKIELAYEQGTVSKHGHCSRIDCFCLTSMASFNPCGFIWWAPRHNVIPMATISFQQRP